MVLKVCHFGASEIYINGKLQFSFGKISNNPDEIEIYHHGGTPAPLQLDSNKYYTLAIRYFIPEATFESFKHSKTIPSIGFIISIDDLDRSLKAPEEDDSFYVAMIAPLLTLSLLSILLFFFIFLSWFIVY